MKKILNYLVAIALVFIQLLPVANAASITINDSVVGQDYNAYKIFDVTKAGDSYAYSIESTNPWFPVVQSYATSKGTIKLTQVGTTTKYVVDASKIDAADFATHLNANKAGKPIVETTTAVEGSATVIDGLTAGYYFIDSSLGALCILHTTTDKLTVFEKNAVPTVEKTVSQTSASVGETVTFTVNITAGGKADTSYILHDKMTEGLTLNADSFEITVGETAVATTNYTIKTTGLTDDCTFEIEFNKAYTSNLEKDTVITVTYTATLNEKAIIKSEDTNEAKVQYGNSSSPAVTVKVYNYDFDLVKTDEEGKQLEGAQFKLFDAKTGGNEIELIKVTENGETFYRPTKEGETAVEYIEAGSIKVKGLEKGTYYLEETKAPEGYNQLTERVAVELNADLTGTSAIKVENTTGSMLPSTGGMGTTLFVLIGSMMVLGFGVLLVTKLRISKMYI